MIFRTPIRRKTRQRSGFNVAGDTPGSECKIKKTGRLNVNTRNLELTFYQDNILVNPLFQNEKGILCFGAYIKPKENLDVTIKITFQLESSPETYSRTMPIYANQWNKIGILPDFHLIKPIKINRVECKLQISNKNKNIGVIDFFGINFGATDYPYFKENEVEDIFYEKLPIYIPEISYHDYDSVQKILSRPVIKFLEGDPITLKSCNRCSRFLPVDILNERNTLSFSNHCVKKAPCTHNAFSRYIIKENDYPKIPKEFISMMQEDKLALYHGYQLECKPCKKFFVNAPLNPLRNSTQHREDSLRRRAIEVLVDTLLGRQWIYHKFRVEQKKEFDNHIWEKFGKKCFKCNKQLKDEHEMDLDHTMPLASFWPLDESATCLCKKCNSLKSDKFPVEFYSTEELQNLSTITGLSLSLLKQKKVKDEVIKKLLEKVDWFFDEFLNNRDYQKVRSGKRTSDLIYKAIAKQIATFYDTNIDLVELYVKKMKKKPNTITV
jgi:hypothetical protein